ncbi:MAG: thiamine-phosphate kinase [Planctomycetaceae bacterium]|nr:thiamine-phosphate kinase [Planctomycetaceae bacterium]
MREFELIDDIVRQNGALPAHVVVPPGDDMAVVRVPRATSRALAVTVGLSARGANARGSWRRAGEEALAAVEHAAARVEKSSGVASLAGVVFLPDTPLADAREWQIGLAARSVEAHLPVVGGDVAQARGDFSALACVFGFSTRPTSACAQTIAVDDAPDGEFLLACDSAIEGRHVPSGFDPARVARKAVLRNLSDVAAMGGARPVAIAAGVFGPAALGVGEVSRIEQALRETGTAFGAPLVGFASHACEGDCPLCVCVAIVAVKLAAGGVPALRSHARAGDGVFVTGSIGGAWDPASGLGRHLDFTPRLAVAHALSKELGGRLGAMIDVSDGLGRDLGHVAELSKVAIDLDLARIPVPAGIDPCAALGHGEDYELAFTARGEVPRELAGVPITRIGTVRAAIDGPAVLAHDGSRIFDARALGFEHGADGG